jgi:uncharacterized membrane protein
MSQNPFDKLNQLQQKVNSASAQASNPGARLKNESSYVKRSINQGTSNVVSALCYVTGIVAFIAGVKKDWKADPQVNFHATHARVLWVIMIVSFCSIIGIPLAAFLYLAGFYLASSAVSGGRQPVPFLTQFIYARHWMD